MRWPVIHDRFELRPPHTLEDMKLRFYTTMARVIRYRSERQQMTLKSQYTDFSYNAQSDIKRRKQADRSFKRTPEQVEEERSLLQEVRAIDALMAEIAARGFEGADAVVLALARRGNPTAPAPMDVLQSQREESSSSSSSSAAGSSASSATASANGSSASSASSSSSNAADGPIGPGGLPASAFAAGAPPSGGAGAGAAAGGSGAATPGAATPGGTGAATPATPSAAASTGGSQAVTTAPNGPTIRKTIPPATQGGPRGGAKAWTGKSSALPVDPFFGVSLRSEQMLAVVRHRPAARCPSPLLFHLFAAMPAPHSSRRTSST